MSSALIYAQSNRSCMKENKQKPNLTKTMKQFNEVLKFGITDEGPLDGE